MERLTEKMNSWQYGMKACGNNCKDGNVCGNISSCKSMNKIIDKLGKYEEFEEHGMYPVLSNELLLEIKQYIENSEYELNDKWGCDGETDHLINQNLMPSLYDDILNLLYKPKYNYLKEK